MKRIVVVLCSAMLLVLGCNSSRQAHGTLVGSMVGGVLGSSIGGMIGGFRGSDIGTVAGMAMGAAVGGAVASREPSGGDYEEGYHQGYLDAYNENHSSESGVDDGVTIQNLRFLDADRDGMISAGEQCKLTFDIYNRDVYTHYDLIPAILVEGTKRIYLSSSHPIESIAPGKGMRYTATVVGAKKLKNGFATFHLGFSKGPKRDVRVLRSFQVGTFDGRAKRIGRD